MNSAPAFSTTPRRLSIHDGPVHEQAHEGGVPCADDQRAGAGARPGGNRAAECEGLGFTRLPWFVRADCLPCFGDRIWSGCWQNIGSRVSLTCRSIICLQAGWTAFVAYLLRLGYICVRAGYLSVA